MKALTRVCLVIALQFTVLACASFTYKYYGIGPDQAGEMRGTIRGHSDSEDQPLSACMPDAQTGGKCVLLFVDEFERLRADLVDTKERLKACEQGRG